MWLFQRSSCSYFMIMWKSVFCYFLTTQSTFLWALLHTLEFWCGIWWRTQQNCRYEDWLLYSITWRHVAATMLTFLSVYTNHLKHTLHWLRVTTTKLPSKKAETGVKFIMRSFINHLPRQLLLEWSHKGKWGNACSTHKRKQKYTRRSVQEA